MKREVEINRNFFVLLYSHLLGKIITFNGVGVEGFQMADSTVLPTTAFRLVLLPPEEQVVEVCSFCLITRYTRMTPVLVSIPTPRDS